MIAFEIDGRAPEARWRRTPAGWAADGHRVEPFRNPALEDFALEAPGRIVVAVRERGSGVPSPFPVGRTTAVGPDALDRALGDLYAWPLCWCVLTIRTDGGELVAELANGGWGTAPVFLTARDGNLRGHWDAARLYPADVAGPAAVRFLADFETTYSRRTLLAGVMMATERARATWTPAAAEPLAVEYPRALARPRPRTLEPRSDPARAFFTILRDSVARWAGHGRVGAELSGGLDSGVVAAAATAVTNEPLRSYGIRLGTAGQDRRRADLVDCLGLRDATVDLVAFPPLDPAGPRVAGGQAVPWEEVYYEASDALNRVAAADGVTTILTGFGGDELCTLAAGERRRSSASTAREAPAADGAPAFLAPLGRDALAAARSDPDPAPAAGPLASAVETAALSSAMYMRRGLWPVHPLCTPELVHFCAQLPREWRAGRRVEREALAGRGCPDRVVRAPDEDDFSPALVRGLRVTARPLVERMFAESLMAERGWVERDVLARDFHRWCRDGDPDAATTFYSAAVLELALRAATA